MSRSERVREATRSARVIAGMLCGIVGSGLLLWLLCWIVWVCPPGAGYSLSAGPLVLASTFAQLSVALLFLTASVLYFADSPRARRCFQVAGILWLLEIPLVMAAFVIEIASVGR